MSPHEKKAIKKEYDHLRWLKNKDKLKVQKRIYRINHRERIVKQDKEYRAKNKEKIKNQIKRYAIENQGKLKEYRFKNKERNKIYLQKWRSINRGKILKEKHNIYKKHKKYLMQYKMSGCGICGVNMRLAFHHIKNNKIFELSNGAFRSRMDIIKEIQKCVLLCTSCHAKAHKGTLSESEILIAFNRFQDEVVSVISDKIGAGR